MLVCVLQPTHCQAAGQCCVKNSDRDNALTFLKKRFQAFIFSLMWSEEFHFQPTLWTAEDHDWRAVKCSLFGHFPFALKSDGNRFLKAFPLLHVQFFFTRNWTFSKRIRSARSLLKTKPDLFPAL